MAPWSSLVSDGHNGPLEVLECPGEDVDGGGVEVVGGLVQEEEVAWDQGKGSQRNPRLLATAQHA